MCHEVQLVVTKQNTQYEAKNDLILNISKHKVINQLLFIMPEGSKYHIHMHTVIQKKNIKHKITQMHTIKQK